MPINKSLPNSFLNSGIKSLLSNHNMLAFFKKFCTIIISRTWKFKKGKNRRYDDIDHLRVFFISEIIGRSIHNTSEMLNEYYLTKRKGRRKIFTDGRKKREIPHQTEVNKYLRKIGLNFARKILQECLDAQLKEALEQKIISKKINILIDFTEHPYYGKRNDPMIKGTTRQKGTKKMRHYLGFSVLSRNIHLYAGLEHVPQGQSKIPIIIQFLDHLLDLGFELKYILMDREFYRTELLDAVRKRGGNVLIPAKFYKKIKLFIENYLKGKRNRVRRYVFSTATEAKRHFSIIVSLIIRAKQGFSLQSIKRDFQNKKISLKDAQKRLFVIMTTERPRGNTSSWASRTSSFYRRRWLIETGFSDLNRINYRWKSNHDNVRYLDMLARFLLYNSWKMNRALIEKHIKKPQGKSAWTLHQNQDFLKERFLSMEKKSGEVSS